MTKTDSMNSTAAGWIRWIEDQYGAERFRAARSDEKHALFQFISISPGFIKAKLSEHAHFVKIGFAALTDPQAKAVSYWLQSMLRNRLALIKGGLPDEFQNELKIHAGRSPYPEAGDAALIYCSCKSFQNDPSKACKHLLIVFSRFVRILELNESSILKLLGIRLPVMNVPDDPHQELKLLRKPGKNARLRGSEIRAYFSGHMELIRNAREGGCEPWEAKALIGQAVSDADKLRAFYGKVSECAQVLKDHFSEME